MGALAPKRYASHKAFRIFLRSLISISHARPIARKSQREIALRDQAAGEYVAGLFLSLAHLRAAHLSRAVTPVHDKHPAGAAATAAATNRNVLEALMFHGYQHTLAVRARELRARYLEGDGEVSAHGMLEKFVEVKLGEGHLMLPH